MKYTDDQLIAAWNRKEMAPCGHIEHMQNNGINMQLISPRPFQTMHSEKPGYLVEWYIHECNKIIADSVRLFPDKFFGVGGIPQQGGEPVSVVFAEMEHCVKNYGFKGFLLNPTRMKMMARKRHRVGDRYWYPLYEKACELNVPLHIILRVHVFPHASRTACIS